MSRLTLSRDVPQNIEHYAEQTRQLVDDLADQLHALFDDERAGRVSVAWARTLDRLFALWCEQGGVVSPTTARAVVERIDPGSFLEVLKAVRRDLGFTSDEATAACEEYVAAARGPRGREAALRRLEQRLYRPQVRSLCVQSAHVTLARAVLYRVLEDRGLARRLLSGQVLSDALGTSAQGLLGTSATPALDVLEGMRRASEDFLPSLYQRRELDWWLIPFPKGDRQQELFNRRLGALEVDVSRMLRVLDGYDFAVVDQDVWRDVYEHHLPSDQRQQLG